MRAVRVHAFGQIDYGRIEGVPDPLPGSGELVVSVRAVPVNYVDLLTLRGAYQFKPPLPYTPGKGPAGEISLVGPDVEGLDVGDRVLAMAEYGGYAELVRVGAAQVYRLPSAMSFVEAAGMSLAFDTAWMALRQRARFSSGESVLVLGATGAVGGAAIRLAKAMGARIVLAAVSSPDQFAIVEGHGADAMIDLSRPNLRDSVRDQVFAVADGGVDVVLDPVGGDAFDGAIRSLAWGGRLVVIGFASGRIPTLQMNYPLLKNIEVSGLQISDFRRRRPDLVRECYDEVFSYYEAGLLKPLPTMVFALSEWSEALRLVESRSSRARIVLVPGHEASGEAVTAK